jgi:hypothetical protein
VDVERLETWRSEFRLLTSPNNQSPYTDLKHVRHFEMTTESLNTDSRLGELVRSMTSDTSHDVHSQLPMTQRVSMEDYYHSQLFGASPLLSRIPSSEDPQRPPSYEATVQTLQLPASRYKVQPRADEGKEELPGYSCPISLQGVFMIKMELQSAIHKAQDRNWYKYWAVLQGTVLSIHRTKREGIMARQPTGPRSTPDRPPGLKAGALLKSYTLQHAEVGIAADYKKYNNLPDPSYII